MVVLMNKHEWVKAPNGPPSYFICVDLNECESNPCSQECANVYGSYQCYCRRGYQLSDIDGMTCEGKKKLFKQE